MEVVGKSITEVVNYNPQCLMLPLVAKMFPLLPPVVKVGSHPMLDPCSLKPHTLHLVS